MKFPVDKSTMFADIGIRKVNSGKKKTLSGAYERVQITSKITLQTNISAKVSPFLRQIKKKTNLFQFFRRTGRLPVAGENAVI